MALGDDGCRIQHKRAYFVYVGPTSRWTARWPLLQVAFQTI